MLGWLREWFLVVKVNDESGEDRRKRIEEHTG